MLNFINFKKLTVNGILAVLVAGSLTIQSNLAVATNNSDNTSCRSNNGHGNNKPVRMDLTGFYVLITYDPSNPGNSTKNRATLYNISNKQVNPKKLPSDLKEKYDNIVANIQTIVEKDIELRGKSSNGSDCTSETPVVQPENKIVEVPLDQITRIDVLADPSTAQNSESTNTILDANIADGSGEVTVGEDNKIVYNPGSEAGEQKIEYTVETESGTIETETITVVVQNASPIAVDDEVEVYVNDDIDINVLINDSDPENQAITIVNISNVTGGSAEIKDNHVVYIAGSEPGNYTFDYTIEDESGAQATATVTVQILGYAD